MRGMGQWARGPESWGLSQDPPPQKKKTKKNTVLLKERYPNILLLQLDAKVKPLATLTK